MYRTLISINYEIPPLNISEPEPPMIPLQYPTSKYICIVPSKNIPSVLFLFKISFIILTSNISYYLGFKYLLLSWLQISLIILASNISYYPGFKYLLLSWLQISFIIPASNISYYPGFKYLLLSWLQISLYILASNIFYYTGFKYLSYYPGFKYLLLSWLQISLIILASNIFIIPIILPSKSLVIYPTFKYHFKQSLALCLQTFFIIPPSNISFRPTAARL